MKKNLKVYAIVAAFVMVSGIMFVFGSGFKGREVTCQPDFAEISTFCKLASKKVTYNNVAVVSDDWWMFGARNKKMWIQYTGDVKIGIDGEKLKYDINGRNITFTIPKAEIISQSVDVESLNENSYKTSKSRRKISAEKQNKALAKGDKYMYEKTEENHQLMHSSQVSARKIIENYFDEISRSGGEKYNLTFKYE